MIDGITLPHRFTRKNFFQLSLLLGTVCPIAFLAIPQLHPPGTELFKYLLLFAAIAHVPATSCFYASKEFRQIIINNKAIYIITPIGLFAASGATFALSPHLLKPLLLLFYWAWQSWHYGKQNIGVYSFISYAQGKPASNLERRAIYVGAIAGILPIWKILGLEVAPVYLHNYINWSYFAGYFVIALAFLLSIYTLWSRQSRFTIIKTIFFFLSVLFFLPAYFPGDVLTTFLSYATAHAMQYIIFMAAVVDEKSTLNSLYSLFACLIIGGLIFVYLPSYADFLSGGFLGLTMAHFVIDAHAWKLSQPNQKNFVLSRFSFLMKK